MVTQNEVLFDRIIGQGGDLGIIILNRPNALNSLTHSMVNLIYVQLQTWARDIDVKAVVIRAAEGRAFCAGGDLRELYAKYKTDPKHTDEFFRDEYHLNRLIFHYPKPYIAILDGICMGGGVGISIHGSHRVATDRLVFAMPETGIGFFPDVGGTYFLPRLPGYIGYYLGLTGARLKVDDCMALGIVQQKVAMHSLTSLLDALAQHPYDDDAKTAVTHVIAQFKVQSDAQTILEKQAAIDNYFSKPSMEEIMQGLASSADAEWNKEYEALLTKSPSSLKVTLKALTYGQDLDFDVCMQQEYRLTRCFLQRHDFMEGIRALLIDKDQQPNWQPKTLPLVTEKQVDDYFSEGYNRLNHASMA